jgi:hypothetical protein
VVGRLPPAAPLVLGRRWSWGQTIYRFRSNGPGSSLFIGFKPVECADVDKRGWTAASQTVAAVVSLSLGYLEQKSSLGSEETLNRRIKRSLEEVTGKLTGNTEAALRIDHKFARDPGFGVSSVNLVCPMSDST